MNKLEGKFAVKRTATGLGLITLQPISKGNRIIEYVGGIISNEEGQKKGGKYLFQLDEKRVVDGSSRSNLARYMNHSCRPNATAYTVRGRKWIYAKKDIKGGEAITINYGKEYFEEHIKPVGCKCEKCIK